MKKNQLLKKLRNRIGIENQSELRETITDYYLYYPELNGGYQLYKPPTSDDIYKCIWKDKMNDILNLKNKY